MASVPTVTLWRPVGPKELASIKTPAEDLPAFNAAIVGEIEVTASFP